MANDIGGLSWEQFRNLPLDRRQSHLKSVQRLGGIFNPAEAPANTFYDVNGSLRTKIPSLSPGLTGPSTRGRHYGVRSRSSSEFDEMTSELQVAFGRAVGSSSVYAIGAGEASSLAQSLGDSAVYGTANGTASALGLASGSSSALGISTGTATTRGAATGTSSVVGTITGTNIAAGQAAGSASTNGFSSVGIGDMIVGDNEPHTVFQVR